MIGETMIEDLALDKVLGLSTLLAGVRHSEADLADSVLHALDLDPLFAQRLPRRVLDHIELVRGERAKLTEALADLGPGGER